MNSTVAAIFQYRFLVVIVSILVGGAVFLQLRESSVDLLPEFAPPLIEVQTEALGLSAEEVEALITVPMEADLLTGISWTKTIRSKSIPGLSSIVMVFEDGTDIWKARQLVQERLTQAHALPNVSQPPVMLQPLSSTSRVMTVGLSSQALSNMEISVQAHWVMRPRLMGVPGVANVSIWGERRRQLQVQVDPARLGAHNVTLDTIVSTAGNSLSYSPLSYLNASTPGSGGFIDTPNQRLSVRHVLPISSAEDLANVVIEGTRSRLGDVATIVEDHQPLIGDAIVGGAAGVILVIEKFPWADTSTVTQGIDEALKALSLSLPGVDIDSTIYRNANFIEAASDNIWYAATFGALLLLAGLIVVLRSARAVLVSATAISASLIVAGGILHNAGAGFDVIMMTGLAAAIAVVVVDAVCDVFSLAWPSGAERLSLAGAMLGSMKRSRTALGFATAVAVLSTVPVYAMIGIDGAVAVSMAMPFAVAVLASLLVSMTLTPALIYILFSRSGAIPPADATPGGAGHLARLPAIKAPLFGLACIVAFSSVVLIGTARRDMVPTFKERDLVIDWSTAPGTSHPAMVRVASNVISDLRDLPGIKNVGAHFGRAIASDRVHNVNAGQIWITIDPAADYNETLAAVRETIAGYPDAAREVLTYSDLKARQFTKSDAETLTVRTFGYDLEKLRILAGGVRDMVASVDGLSDVQIEVQDQEPVLRIEVDLEKSREFGIKPGDVRRSAAVLLSGLEVGSLFENQKVFEVVVWGVPDIRRSATSVSDILIDTPEGGVVRLRDVANVSIGSLPTVIQRDAVSRYVDVTAKLTDGNAANITSELRARIADTPFPFEYHAEVLNDVAEANADTNALVFAMVAAAIGIFLVIQAAVGGWRLATATLVSSVAALSGGVVVIAASSEELSLGALAGLMALFAIAARCALLQIQAYQTMERGGAHFGLDLVVSGTAFRLLPVIATGLAAALAFAPAAVIGPVPGLESVAPFALVLIGGLVTTTLVSLYVVPAIYLMFGENTALSQTDHLTEGENYAV